jgi:hypothetical protein
MVDLGKVEGPSGAPDSFGKKDKNSVDTEKFKEAMRRRVTEVSQVDPDEQKKRKRREEAEEEEALEEPVQGPTVPAFQVTPFSLEAEQKKVSPMEKQATGISPLESAQKATLPSPPSKPFFQTPSIDEMTDDSGGLEEESFMQVIPSAQETTETPPPPTAASEETTPQTFSQPSPPQQPSVESRPSEVEQPIEPPTSTQQDMDNQPSEKKPEEKPSEKKPEEKHLEIGPPPQKKRDISTMQPELSSLKIEQKKQVTGPSSTRASEKGTIAAEIETTALPKVETAGFFEKFGKQGEKEKEHKKPPETAEESEKEAEAQETINVGLPPPIAPALEQKNLEEEKEKLSPDTTEGAPLPLAADLPGAAIFSPSQEALPSYANIHPQVMEIFDRMVGVMTVMNMSGMTETVITLNAPQFASSIFFGSQIIIQEFSTAPQAFNIQLNGTAQAVALFQGNANDLMAAFQAGNYNFRINRLETGYLTERPLFKRKEKAGEKETDTGDSRQ